MKNHHTPWVFKLPAGLREQPAAAFVGLLYSLSGVSYLLGIAESTSITRVLDPSWMRVWGGAILIAGTLLLFSLFSSNKPLEMFASRIISVCSLVYLGWVIVAVPLKNLVITMVLILVIVILMEIRVAVIKVLLRPRPHLDGEADR